MAMDGIAALLVSNHKVLVQYEVIDDAGGLSILECEVYFLPDINVRPFSPQFFIQELQECGGTYTII